MEKEVVSILPSKDKVFNSTDLKRLCGGLTKLMDYAEKLPELPQTIFPHLIPRLYLELNRNCTGWPENKTQCGKLSASIDFLNPLYSYSSK